MRTNPQGQLALFLVLASIVVVLILEGGADALRKIEWFEPRMFGMPALACAVLGTILGWVDLRSTPGKLAAAIGTSMLLYVFLIYTAKSTVQNDIDPHSGKKAAAGRVMIQGEHVSVDFRKVKVAPMAFD